MTNESHARLLFVYFLVGIFVAYYLGWTEGYRSRQMSATTTVIDKGE